MSRSYFLCVDVIAKFGILTTQVHILDNYLLDGEKIFYRVGLVTFEQVYNECKKRGEYFIEVDVI